MRLLIAVAGAVAAIVLFFVLRAEDETSFEPAGPRTTETAATPTTEPTVTQPVTPRRVGLLARVEVRGGRPVGGVQRFRVQKGARVVLVVRSDVPDHVHVHGHDLMRDVGPRATARLAFRATLTGRFEVELEERGVPIAELEVRP